MKRQKLFTQRIADYKCGEFHITPVITLAWPTKEILKEEKEDLSMEHYNVFMFCIALEWGFWAVTVGYWRADV